MEEILVSRLHYTLTSGCVRDLSTKRGWRYGFDEIEENRVDGAGGIYPEVFGAVRSPWD